MSAWRKGWKAVDAMPGWSGYVEVTPGRFLEYRKPTSPRKGCLVRAHAGGPGDRRVTYNAYFYGDQAGWGPEGLVNVGVYGTREEAAEACERFAVRWAAEEKERARARREAAEKRRRAAISEASEGYARAIQKKLDRRRKRPNPAEKGAKPLRRNHHLCVGDRVRVLRLGGPREAPIGTIVREARPGAAYGTPREVYRVRLDEGGVYPVQADALRSVTRANPAVVYGLRSLLQAVQDVAHWARGARPTAHVRFFAARAGYPKGGDRGFWAGEVFAAIRQYAWDIGIPTGPVDREIASWEGYV